MQQDITPQHIRIQEQQTGAITNDVNTLVRTTITTYNENKEGVWNGLQRR